MTRQDEIEELARELFEICCYPDPTKWKYIEDNEKDVWKYRASIINDKYMRRSTNELMALDEIEIIIFEEALSGKTITACECSICSDKHYIAKKTSKVIHQRLKEGK